MKNFGYFLLGVILGAGAATHPTVKSWFEKGFSFLKTKVSKD